MEEAGLWIISSLKHSRMSTDATNGRLSIILFDGSCNLCNGTVDFIRSHNKKSQFSFIPLDSEKASEYIIRFKKHGLNKGSVALIRNEMIYLKSDAVLEIVKHLDGFWPLFHILIIVPRFIRDPVYYLIARNRYKFF